MCPRFLARIFRLGPLGLLGLIVSLAASPGMAAAPPLPPSSSSHSDSLVVITLEKDVQMVVARVEPHGREYIRLVRLDGSTAYVPVHRVVSIRDWTGRDRTRDVLVGRKHVGDPSVVAAPKGSRGFQFTGAPLQETRWFMITHVGVAARLDQGSSLYERSGAYVLADVGAMRNMSDRWAIGGNLYVGADDYRSRVGPKARVRYWLNRGTSVDAAAGILFDGADDWKGGAIFPGYVGEVNLGFHDAFLLTAEVEAVDIEKEGSKDLDTSWYLGAKLGGVGAVIVTFAGLAALGFIHAMLGS